MELVSNNSFTVRENRMSGDGKCSNRVAAAREALCTTSGIFEPVLRQEIGSQILASSWNRECRARKKYRQYNHGTVEQISLLSYQFRLVQ